MSLKLTKPQRKALEFLRDNKEYGDMVYERGSGWWLGDNRTNGILALGLIQLCLVSMDSISNSDKFARWTINESGLRALDGKPPYRNSEGIYKDSLCEIYGV